MNSSLKKILKKQQYKIIGNHSAVKLCHWTREKLIKRRVCYKEFFYGINCHRCLQFTPTVDNCNQQCLFCWRFHGFSEISKEDEPEFLLNESIKAQRELTSGFKGDERCTLKLWEEARNPKHIAISLTGEPTLYSKLGEFIELCHKKGMTTFLVSNGTTPNVLEKLNTLPTQLYITVASPNEEIYKKLCIPLVPKAWEKLNQTLELLPSLNTRTVIRHTLVDNWNIGYEEKYAKLIEKANPLFVESKAYMFVGYSRQNLSLKNMPSHKKIQEFSRKLSSLISYELAMEKEDSRVCLLTRDKSNIAINF